MSQSAPLAVLRDVAAGYGRKTVFQSANLVVGSRRIHAVLGPSGCGKTTLLRMLARLLPPQAGTLELSDSTHSRVAYIPQEYGLFPWKTVWQNAAMGLELAHGRLTATDRTRIAALLDELGIRGLKHRWPATLSGGQKQRTALARALALSADLLLMDEPFSALDADIREELQDLVRTLPATHGSAVVIATHEIREAIALADELWIFCPDTARGAYTIQSVVKEPGREAELAEHVRACLREARKEPCDA